MKTANRKKAENQSRVTSITRRLHFRQIRKWLGRCFRGDLLLALTACAAFLAGRELAETGTFHPEYSRYFTSLPRKTEIVYRVADRGGKLVLELEMTSFLLMLLAAACTVFILQFLWVWISYIHEDRKIREILSPLDQLALRADELSRLSFSEDKYQVLEQAIDRIRPEEAGLLSLGDSDLAGVEAAMNNLLLRMRDSYRQQARFVNDASHELRTPIAVIQGYVNMLERWGKEDESILDESIAAIRNESEHMNHLVEQLLFLARGDSGRTALHPEKTDLNALMQEIYEESFMIDETHPYRFSGTGEPLTAGVDPGLFKQSIRILVDNAAKYTKPGDEIQLSCGRTEAGECFVQVQDTGIGMAEADVRHMFERFYRSDEARSYAGTGLGLSIAKWIVDRHCGHFEILSRPGLGTRIRIVLPERLPEGAGQPRPAENG